jgi:hypothetical protein
VGTRCADHETPLYPQKLALTSPAGGGRSVGIVRSPTKATEFSFSLVYIGPLVNFVAKDNANYQFAELPMNMNTRACHWSVP